MTLQRQDDVRFALPSAIQKFADFRETRLQLLGLSRRQFNLPACICDFHEVSIGRVTSPNAAFTTHYRYSSSAGAVLCGKVRARQGSGRRGDSPAKPLEPGRRRAQGPRRPCTTTYQVLRAPRRFYVGQAGSLRPITGALRARPGERSSPARETIWPPAARNIPRRWVAALLPRGAGFQSAAPPRGHPQSANAGFVQTPTGGLQTRRRLKTCPTSRQRIHFHAARPCGIARLARRPPGQRPRNDQRFLQRRQPYPPREDVVVPGFDPLQQPRVDGDQRPQRPAAARMDQVEQRLRIPGSRLRARPASKRINSSRPPPSRIARPPSRRSASVTPKRARSSAGR